MAVAVGECIKFLVIKGNVDDNVIERSSGAGAGKTCNDDRLADGLMKIGVWGCAIMFQERIIRRPKISVLVMVQFNTDPVGTALGHLECVGAIRVSPGHFLVTVLDAGVGNG